MNWYYALNGQQLGPVSEAELARLVSTNVISGATLLWREGLPDWQPVSVVVPHLTGGADVPQLGGLAVPAAQKDLLVQQMREGVTSTAPGAMRFAGFWIRLLAKIIDGLLLQAVQFVIGLVIGLVVGLAGGRSNETQTVMGIALIVIGLGINLCYQTIMVGKYGATLGKMALGLKIVRADGTPVSMGLAAGRFFGEMLSSLTFLIGYIMAGFDEEKRALHDRVCGTRVIYKAR